MVTGFRAAYEPYQPAAEPRDLAVAETVPPDDRQRTAPAAPASADASTRLSAGHAVAGAALSVCGVVLGIATLLWITDDPAARRDPRAPAPVTQVQTVDPEPTGQLDPAPVDPIPVPPAPAAAPAPPPPVQPPVAAPAPAPAVVPVTVLNNSRIAGLAARGAQQFRDGGWPVAATGNFRGRLVATTVYYPPGQEAAARAFAERFPAVDRVLPRFAGLPGSGLTVVLTRDFA